MGEFTIFTGETGSGKTTFLTQLSLDFLIQRVPTLWGSFEIKNDRLTSLFLMQYAKKELRNAKAEEIEYHYENFDKLPLYLYKFHGSQNIDQVLSTVEYANYNYDIQVIILDNLQFMIGNPSLKNFNRFDLQDEIIYKLRKFATEKNVHIILVIHPKKTDEALTISSIFGTGKASQEADNIFILQSLKGLRVIEIAKNRFDGSTGKTVIGFDQSTCRFFELTEDEFTHVHQGKSKIEKVIEDRKNQYCSDDFTKVKESSDNFQEGGKMSDRDVITPQEGGGMSDRDVITPQEGDGMSDRDVITPQEGGGMIQEACVDNNDFKQLTRMGDESVSEIARLPEPKLKNKANSNLNVPRTTQTELFAYKEETEDTFSEIKTFQRILFPNTNIVGSFHTQDSFEKAKSFSNARRGSYKKDSVVKEAQQKLKVFSELFHNSKT
jgi:archaellum biogenesis ATPase FlaH